jgi:FAD/FMN-containing dehydrogenase
LFVAEHSKFLLQVQVGSVSKSGGTMSDISGLDNLLKELEVPFEENKVQKGYRYGEGVALRFVRPKTTIQVSEIVKYCNENRIKIVPQGGNTGLVGSSTADNSGKQIVISTQLLNKDLIQQQDDTVKVGAGVILDVLNEKLHNSNMFLPIDIGSSGSCNIGGLIATNAAGTRAGRYGNVKSRTLEITVVLANGEIKTVKTDFSYASTNLPQDNSVIDFKNPFIGSQGWLGMVTEGVMRLEAKPVKYETLILVPQDNSAIAKIRHALIEIFGKNLTAFEGMSDAALRLVAKNIPNTRYLFENESANVDYALLVELSTTNEEDDLSNKLVDVLEKLMADGLVITGLMGDSHLYWHHRHHISEAIKLEGQVIATDIAVNGIDNLARFRKEMTDELLQKYQNLQIVPFGHEMLGALHFNMVWSKEKELTPSLKRNIQELVYDKVVNEFGGTFSAEHGIGLYNQWAYDKFTPKEIKEQSAQLKQHLDVNRIFNPNVNYG